jgi:hypothetical protein
MSSAIGHLLRSNLVQMGKARIVQATSPGSVIPLAKGIVRFPFFCSKPCFASDVAESTSGILTLSHQHSFEELFISKYFEKGVPMCEPALN